MNKEDREAILQSLQAVKDDASQVSRIASNNYDNLAMEEYNLLQRCAFGIENRMKKIKKMMQVDIDNEDGARDLENLWSEHTTLKENHIKNEEAIAKLIDIMQAQYWSSEAQDNLEALSKQYPRRTMND